MNLPATITDKPVNIYAAWAEERGKLAQSLGRGALGGSYADGAIILCSAIGAMASILWKPSSRTDAKRFVEIVARFRKPGLDTTRVSAPLLAADFPQVSGALGVGEKSLYRTGRTDKIEADAGALCAAAIILDSKRLVRQYSYANLLYKQVRCGFTHEYQPGKSAIEVDSLRVLAGLGSDEISYVNMLKEHHGAPYRRQLIHFPLEWISAVVQTVAAGIDAECSRQAKMPYENLDLALPDDWWVDGG